MCGTTLDVRAFHVKNGWTRRTIIVVNLNRNYSRHNIVTQLSVVWNSSINEWIDFFSEHRTITAERPISDGMIEDTRRFQGVIDSTTTAARTTPLSSCSTPQAGRRLPIVKVGSTTIHNERTGY